MVKGVLTGRLRAYAYGVVTTTLVLIIAVTESLAESFVASRSRTAGTILEIAIIVVITLAIRPFHRWVDESIEAAFTRRRREARAALTRLRKELTSFNDVQQVLRRIVEAVDHHMGTNGSAIYLRHGSYDVEASTFDVAVTCVEPGDALVIRLRSSSAPADPRALGSAALGTLAFPMMAGGDLVGFLTLEPKHVEIDAEDRHTLAELSESAGIALCALDAGLRAQDTRRSTRPNNLPRQSTSFVGRQDDVTAVCELVRRYPLVTIAGAGGMGKTRLALQVATTLLDETSEGAWFVDLAPIGDGALVASAILSALDADQSGEAEPLDRIVKFLAPRALLLVLDNSEHLIADIARVVDAIVKQCPNVSVLATSREPLGSGGEVVHRLSSLDSASAMQLFAERARAVNDRFAISDTNRTTVAEICSHLGGMALAIELAAARVRSISVEELSHRLQLRVLGSFGREPLARHQTMHALIDWSYDLLSAREQRLFVQLSPFVGGVSLDTAMAAYRGDDLDDLELLDLVTSLVDKSLLVADVSETTQRYRFLEPIREYARERLEKSGDAQDALLRHARTFAQFADAAYEQFDTGPKEDWLERNERELDNVRAALRWSLDGSSSEPDVAGRIAGGFGVVFLRLTLLQEGIDWNRRVLATNAALSPAIEARLHYVLSMLSNNQGHFAASLTAARRALVQYRAAHDQRGVVRALSQVAQQLENTGESGEALVTAEEAVDAARKLDDPGVLASVLGRAGNALGPEHIEDARVHYAEAARLLDLSHRETDRSRILYWWADAEYRAGNFSRAAELVDESLPAAKADVKIVASLLATSVYWALCDRDRAVPATRNGLKLARDAGDPIYVTYALSWMTILGAETNAEDAARLFGYTQQQRQRYNWDSDRFEQATWQDAQRRLRDLLEASNYEALIAEGASWSQERALQVASEF